MPARMRANGNFSDTSLKWLHSVHCVMSPGDAIELESPLNWCHLYSIYLKHDINMSFRLTQNIVRVMR